MSDAWRKRPGKMVVFAKINVLTNEKSNFKHGNASLVAAAQKVLGLHIKYISQILFCLCLTNHPLHAKIGYRLLRANLLWKSILGCLKGTLNQKKHVGWHSIHPYISLYPIFLWFDSYLNEHTNISKQWLNEHTSASPSNPHNFPWLKTALSSQSLGGGSAEWYRPRMRK